MDEDRPVDVTEEVVETVAPSSVTDDAHDVLRAVVERLEDVVSKLETVSAGPAEESLPANDESEDENGETDHTPVTVPWTHRRF